MKNNRIVLSYVMLIFALSINVIYSQDIDELETITPQNIDRLEQLYTTELFDSSIQSISFGLDNTSLVIVLNNRILALGTGNRELEELVNFNKSIQISIISDDGKLFGCICSNQSPIDDLMLFDLETKQELLSVLDLAPATDIAIDAQNKQLITASGWTRESSRVQVWDIEQRILSFTLPANGWTSKVAFSPSGAYIAAGFESIAQIWDVNSQTEVFSVEQSYQISELGGVGLKIGDLAFSPDSNQVASMSPEGFVWLWETATGKMLTFLSDERIIFDDTQSLYSLADSNIKYTPDGTLVATSNGHTLYIWDILARTLIYDVNLEISDFAFSADGKIMATVDSDNKVTLWGIN
jgi:WD40 repeat protein